MKKITAKQRFFDFYSIVELHLKCGGFRDIGYKTYPVFVSHRIEEKIRYTYERIVDSFYKEIYDALVTSIRSELRNYPALCMDYNPEDKLEANGVFPGLIPAVKTHPERYPEWAGLMFTVIRWDRDYGGKLWAKGTELLAETKHVKTREDKVYWVDRVLDLYHNNGHMIDKTKFICLTAYRNILRVRKNGFKSYISALDLRAEAKSILEFIPFNSNEIKKLVIPRKNILTSTSPDVILNKKL